MGLTGVAPDLTGAPPALASSFVTLAGTAVFLGGSAFFLAAGAGTDLAAPPFAGGTGLIGAFLLVGAVAAGFTLDGFLAGVLDGIFADAAALIVAPPAFAGFFELFFGDPCFTTSFLAAFGALAFAAFCAGLPDFELLFAEAIRTRSLRSQYGRIMVALPTKR